MSKLTKALTAAAGNAGGDPLYAEDVFSTYLYTGTGSAQSIDNGIPLSDEGGLVWIKSRSNADSSYLFDTVNGPEETLSSDATTAGANYSAYWDFPSAGTTGFNLKAAPGNYLGWTMASWSFRKAEKFFDVVTWTGNSTAGRTVAHNLGSAPKFVIVKRTDTANNWICWHSGIAITKYLQLNSTSPAYNDGGIFWDSTLPDASNITLGADSGVNATGSTYVAYLFASDAGGFGDDGSENSITCSSFTVSSGSASVTLGYEPQFVIVKAANGTGNWLMFDTMRGMTVGADQYLQPNTRNAEGGGTDFITPTATGFEINNLGGTQTFIYMAIRRPMKTPESGTEVFATAFDAGATNPTYVSGFVADMGIQTNTTGYNKRVSSRLTSGRYLETDNTGAEQTSTSNYTWDFMNGWNNQTINSTWFSWMFKRATGFMDVVAYTGTGSGVRNIAHNLQVAPSMLWLKRRDGASPYGDWYVQTTGIAASQYLTLNSTGAKVTSPDSWDSTYAASNVFTVGPDNNVSNFTYISYLFASLDGVSKVGSYTGTGADLNVDCGFTAGARFILIKRTDSTGDWYVWDSVRGITAGNDPYLLLNTTAAEVTNTDYIDPLSSGFTVTSSAPAALNASGGNYIFLAIA